MAFIIQIARQQRRGSLAWPGRQTHNLEFARGKRPQPEVAGSNPAPGTKTRAQLVITSEVSSLVDISGWSLLNPFFT